MKNLNVDHLNLVLFAVVIMLIFCCCFKKTREGWSARGRQRKECDRRFAAGVAASTCRKGHWPCCKSGVEKSEHKNKPWGWMSAGNCDSKCNRYTDTAKKELYYGSKIKSGKDYKNYLAYFR